MSEATRSDNSKKSTHDRAAERARKALRCPERVKLVAAIILLLAVMNFYYSHLFLSTPVLATLAFFKGLLGIAAAIGLVKLRNGWRIFVLITMGLSLLVLPFYFLAIVLSSDISRLVSELSGIDSRVGIAIAIAFGFAMCLWMIRSLIRPDVERAFDST